MAVFDIGVVALLPIGFGTIDGVEDGGDVWFDREAAIVVVVFQGDEDLTDLGLAVAGEGVFGGFRFVFGWVDAVLDMDVDDVLFHFFVKLERVLPREGLFFRAVFLENGIGGIEDELEAGDFFDKTKGVVGGKASPVHAVFVDGLEAGVGEAGVDFAEATEAFGFVLIISPRFLGIGHDADEAGAEAEHARDGAVDFGEGDVEVGVDLLAPVSDEGAELGDRDTGFVELVGDFFEFLLREFVDVGSVDATGGDLGPADFFGGFDLGGEVLGRFVGESGEIHDVDVSSKASLRNSKHGDFGGEPRINGMNGMLGWGDLPQGTWLMIGGGAATPF